MATISQILPRYWPAAEWRIDGDDYATLKWGTELDDPPVADPSKPAEADIRQYSAAVDAAMAADADVDAQEAAFRAQYRDAFLRAMDAIGDGLAEIKGKVDDLESSLKPAALNSAPRTWDATIVAKIQALRQRVADARTAAASGPPPG